MRCLRKKKMILCVYVTVLFYFPAACLSNTIYAQSGSADHYPKSWATKEIPIPSEKEEDSWFKRNWGWVLLGVLVVGGVAAAGGGGGGGGGDDADVTFAW